MSVGTLPMKNRGYGYFRFADKDGNECIRKPNPKQRKTMLIYYLRRRSGRVMTVKSIAKTFCVSDRTVQKLLKELETEEIIVRTPVFNANGLQTANKIVYTGEKKRLSGKEYTLDKVYAPNNPLRLRDFEWTDFWMFVDNQKMFFHYEEYYGSEGPSKALNERAEKRGYVAIDDYTDEALPKQDKKRHKK